MIFFPVITLTGFALGMAALSIAYLLANKHEGGETYANPFFIIEAVAWCIVAIGAA